ncbi:MAG: sulfur carrier protein ThiS [Phycisphaerales bacterium]
MGVSFVVITVTVNGAPVQVPEGCSVEELVRRCELRRGAYAVEVNRRVVPRRDHGARSLDDGDVVEVVTLVGGG